MSESGNNGADEAGAKKPRPALLGGWTWPTWLGDAAIIGLPAVAVFMLAVLIVQANTCRYEGERVRCGSLVVQIGMDERTGRPVAAVASLLADLRKTGADVELDEAHLGLLIVDFDERDERLAARLDDIRAHPAVLLADYDYMPDPAADD